MAKGMHMVMGLSSLNTRKRKLKITKQRMLELVEQHRLYNKEMKQSNKLDMMMTFDEYLDWSFGKKKLPKSSKSNFTPMTSMTISTTKKYPSHVSDKVDKYACSKMKLKSSDASKTNRSMINFKSLDFFLISVISDTLPFERTLEKPCS